VILINLLPHREEKRLQRKRSFFVGLLACVLGGVAIVGIWFSVLQQATSVQESRNSFLKAEIARLDSQIKDIATLNSEIEALKARQRAVEDLQTDRNVSLYNSPWLEKPELIEIKASAVSAANREQRRLFEFSMRVSLKRPQTAPAPAGGVSGAAPAAAPAKSS